MKQISLLQGKALLVELPEGAKMQGLQTTSPNAIVYADTHGHGVILDLPPGNWRIIGMLSEVTEKDIDGLIEPVKVFDYDAHYWNYKDKEYQPIRVDESLESAILAEGYYLDENPIPEPDISRYPNDDWIADYNNAQSRVLDRSRCLLLGRED